MKDFRTRFLKAWPAAVKVMLCVMALFAGLYLRQLTAKKETAYTKQTHSAHTQSHELYLTVNEPEVPQEETTDLSSLWNNAIDAGTGALQDITGTVLESEFGKTVFDEKEREDLQNLTDLATQLIDLLKTDDMQE
ncbi:MAG: hypothetical protein IJM63_13345 [Solobacterium sp.]|nr:hypothetical protein [Solobacterium sp.]